MLFEFTVSESQERQEIMDLKRGLVLAARHRRTLRVDHPSSVTYSIKNLTYMSLELQIRDDSPTHPI